MCEYIILEDLLYGQDVYKRQGLRVWIVAGSGISIDDPVKLTIHSDDIGIFVISQERSDGLHAVHDITVDEDLRITIDIGGDQQIDIALADREKNAVEQRHIDTGSTFILGIDIVVARGVVKLRLISIDHYIIIGTLTEVDLRTVDGDLLNIRDRRDAVDHHIRLTAIGNLIDAGEGDAVAVRIDEVAVHPLIGDCRFINLTGREEGLGLSLIHI